MCKNNIIIHEIFHQSLKSTWREIQIKRHYLSFDLHSAVCYMASNPHRKWLYLLEGRTINGSQIFQICCHCNKSVTISQCKIFNDFVWLCKSNQISSDIVAIRRYCLNIDKHFIPKGPNNEKLNMLKLLSDRDCCSKLKAVLDAAAGQVWHIV